MIDAKAINTLNSIKQYYNDKNQDSYVGLDDEDNEALEMAIKALKQTRWIPVSERLPKENEYVENVCKYYLIQDEYGDMHVAHLSNVGWIPMDSLNAIDNEIIAWQELPQVYVPEINVGDMAESEDKYADSN